MGASAPCHVTQLWRDGQDDRRPGTFGAGGDGLRVLDADDVERRDGPTHPGTRAAAAAAAGTWGIRPAPRAPTDRADARTAASRSPARGAATAAADQATASASIAGQSRPSSRPAARAAAAASPAPVGLTPGIGDVEPRAPRAVRASAHGCHRRRRSRPPPPHPASRSGAHRGPGSLDAGGGAQLRAVGLDHVGRLLQRAQRSASPSASTMTLALDAARDAAQLRVGVLGHARRQAAGHDHDARARREPGDAARNPCHSRSSTWRARLVEQGRPTGRGGHHRDRASRLAGHAGHGTR